MHVGKWLLSSFLVSLFTWSSANAAPVQGDFPWRSWGPEAFEEAKRDGKFVLLSLQAWWCEPCHRMNSITYSDASVRKVIDAHFVPVYVDQDARPDLSQRFERWGWPATVLFGADGTEIVKLRGFYSPQFFIPVLEATVADPSPVDYGKLGGPERPRQQLMALPDKNRDFLVEFFSGRAYDEANGGWGNRTKLIDGPTLDYAFERARLGDATMRERLRRQLDGMLRMIDPETGAMSKLARMDWSRPFAEYTMFAQEGALRGFSAGYALFGDKRYADGAARVYQFIRDTLSAPDGGVYASMGRESFNPGVDKHRYSRENGKAIAGLTAYHDATGNTEALQLALRHARWVLENRRIAGGGFSHDAKDAGGPFLADNLEMARALLYLHRSTGTRHWLDEAVRTAGFIADTFVDAGTGAFLAAATPAGAFMAESVKQKDDNVLATRFFNELHAYTGTKRWRDIAEAGLGYLASAAVLEAYYFLPGVLQAEEEFAHEPLHLTVVGAKDDPAAAALYKAILSVPAVYKRAEWWDRSEGPLPNPDVKYPKLPRAAAFACSGNVCSLPVMQPDQVASAAEKVLPR